MKQFADYVTLAQQMTQGAGERDALDDEMEKMFSLKASDLPSQPWVKETLSPDFRNACIAGARMLSAADPKWSVPNTAPDQQKQAEEWELFANRTWKGAGLVARKPVHFDMALSAMIYGRVNLRAKLVSDLLTLAKGNPGRTRRLEQIMQRTPVLFDVPNPRDCHALVDETGLTAHLVKRKMAISEVISISKLSEQQLAGRQPSETVIVYEIYDDEQHVMWIEGQKDPLLLLPLEGGIIPVAYADVEGSSLFAHNDNVDAVQPFGYGVYKSGLWKRQNLTLTVFYSLFYAIGSNPVFVSNVGPEIDLTPDFSVPGGVVRVGERGGMQQLVKSVFTPDFEKALTMADQKMVESTMYRTVMGESMGSGTPYSLAALLSQNGRQALIPYERMVEHTCSMGMQAAVLMLKEAGGKLVWSEQGAKKELDTKNIPDDISLEAALAVDLPVDEAKNIQLALQITSGDHPLASHQHAREKFLNIGQSSIMDYEILRERVAWTQAQAEAQAEIQKIMAQAQAQIQQTMAQASQQGPIPGQGGPNVPQGPQGVPQGIPGAQGSPLQPPLPAQIQRPQQRPPGNIPPEIMAQLAQGQQDQNLGQPLPPEALNG